MAEALALDIPTTPVPANQVADGFPETGLVALTQWAEHEVGVWVMTPGQMTDVEVDELCIIIAGAGVVHRSINGNKVEQELRPGSIFQLIEGEETLWVIGETVRKIYVA